MEPMNLLGQNVYAPLAASESAVPVPRYKLFEEGSLGWATFLGGPVGGFSLLALNYQNLGRKSDAWLALLGGIALYGASVAVSFMLPPSIPSMPISVAITVGTYRLAKHLQSASIEAHRDIGGQFNSRWVGAGVGGTFLLVLAVALLANFYPILSRSKVALGPQGTIVYSGKATKAEALALASRLRIAVPTYGDQPSEVMLSTDKDGMVLSFVLQDGAWDENGVESGFEEIARGAAQDIGGLPVKMRLMNGEEKIERETIVR